MLTESLIDSYRFKVYPVDRCPKNAIEFVTRARRRNCTENTRYLCAPDKELTSLIEFCTDQRRSLYQYGNCLKLEGVGYLNHYKCVDKFISGCPTTPYTDDRIYQYPACLSINQDLRCFVADKNCRKRPSATTEAYDNGTRKGNGGNEISPGSFNTTFLIACILTGVLVLILAGIIIYKKAKQRKIYRGEIEEIEVDDLRIGEWKLENETPIKKNQIDEKVKEIQIDEQKLREFLCKGELSVCHVRCVIVGCAGAGKTTLLRRLQNLTFEELISTESTEIIDVHVKCFEVLEDKETIQSVDKRNELPTFFFTKNLIEAQTNTISWTDVSVKVGDVLEKSEQTISSEKNQDHTQSCKPAQEFIDSKEHTDEKDKDKGRYFRENENKNANDVFESVETKQKDESLREKITFPEGDKNDISDNEDTAEDTKLLCLPQCKEEIVKEGTEDERSWTIMTYSPEMTLINSKINTFSSAYISDKNHGNSESNERISNEKDECYAISKIMDDVNKHSSDTLLRPQISFLDFAGQSLYYAFHQIFLSPKSCYILVVDMTKSLNELVLEPEEDEIDCSRFKSWKYQDYYKFWLQSIDSYSDTTTPVIIVGTHDDKLSKAECRKFFREFFQCFEDFSYLRRHLNHDRTFAIGFPKTGQGLDNLSDIKKCIAKLVRDPWYFEKHIRPVWAIFEHILQRKKTKRVMSRKELSEINVHLSEEFRMKEEEVTKMLCYLHRVGNLLYFYEKGLDQTIILDIQWFVNAFKSLIQFTVDINDSDYSWYCFKSTGIITDGKLTEIWKRKAKEEYLLHKEKILPYMERLGLLAMQHETEAWYYIPSMNKRKFRNTDIDMEGSKSSILCFQFDENSQLPVFLFYGIILKCMQIPNWSILREHEKICLYENAACFLFLDHIVVVCLCKYQIQVQVWVPAKEKIDVNVLKEVELSIERKILEYKRYKYDVGYKCQNGMLNSENDSSFIAKIEFPLSKTICDKCKVSKKHYVDNRICWIPKENPKNEDTKYTLETNEDTDEGRVSIKQIVQACLDGNIEQFNFHLEKEIGKKHHLLMKSDSNGWNVLHVAAKIGNLTIFCKLVSEDLKICQKTHSQMTVLHIASKFGHFEICKFILKNDDFKRSVCEKSSERKNACHYAAESGSVKILRLLVENGIDAKAVTVNKLNIFHIACIYNKLEMCKYIFDNFNDLVVAESNDGWTAALHAAKNGNTDVLKFLVEQGMRLNLKSETDRNALHIACDHGHFKVSKFLIDTSPFLLSACDEKGRYPVHFAARSGNMKLLKYLDEFKTEMTKETNTGMNILHMACLHDHIEMCTYLLKRYPDLNEKCSKNGWTTAHYVAGRGNNKGNEIEIFKMLRNAEIPVDIMHLSKHGSSVLTLAIKYNVCEFAEYLFKNHCNMLNIPDANNPWETGNEHPKMLELLHKYLDKPRY